MPAPRKAPRLPDVAQLADVSPGLVSRILNDPTLRVRPETRERVMSAIETLQYTPHASARALRSSHTALLGFALHHVNDPIYAEMIAAAQAAAAERNYSIVMLDADALATDADTFRTVVRGHRVDGLLVQTGYGADSDVVHELAAAIPSLIFNASAVPGLRTLRPDDTAAARLATRYLLEVGHRDIAFVGAQGESHDRRYQGYVQALAEKDLAPQPAIVGSWDADGARQATTRYFAEGGRATGIVAATTTSALGVHAGVVTAGFMIPGDVSVVGIHDTWFAPHLNPALTTVALPIGDIGRRAVELLLDQIRTPTDGETVLTEPVPELVERASVGRPARPIV